MGIMALAPSVSLMFSVNLQFHKFAQPTYALIDGRELLIVCESSNYSCCNYDNYYRVGCDIVQSSKRLPTFNTNL